MMTRFVETIRTDGTIETARDYFIVTSKEGDNPVGIQPDGPYFAGHGYEQRFDNAGSAGAFGKFAAQAMGTDMQVMRVRA